MGSGVGTKMEKPRQIYKFDGKTPVFYMDLRILIIEVGVGARIHIKREMRVILSQRP